MTLHFSHMGFTDGLTFMMLNLLMNSLNGHGKGKARLFLVRSLILTSTAR